MDLKAGPDVRVFLFTAAVPRLTVLVVGLLPAGIARADLAPSLKEQAGTASPHHTRFRKALVGAQVALSVLLLVQAGLFARSLVNLRQLGTGFPIENLVAFNLNPSHAGYDARAPRLLRAAHRRPAEPARGCRKRGWPPWRS